MVRAAAFVLCAVAIALAGCGSEQTKGQDAVTQRDIKTVMEAHVGTLMAIPGVTAVAIGALDDGTPCVTVYVEEENEETRRAIPKTLEGHPVVVEVSGKIEPMKEG
jgi:outer membrane lipoprotein SlyB